MSANADDSTPAHQSQNMQQSSTTTSKREKIENSLPQRIGDVFDSTKWTTVDHGSPRFAGVGVWNEAVDVVYSHENVDVQTAFARTQPGAVTKLLESMVNSDMNSSKAYLDMFVHAVDVEPKKFFADNKRANPPVRFDVFVVVEPGTERTPGLVWAVDENNTIHPIVTTSRETLMMTTWDMIGYYNVEDLNNKKLFELTEDGKPNVTLLDALNILEVHNTYQEAFNACENVCSIKLYLDADVNYGEYDFEQLHLRSPEEVSKDMRDSLNNLIVPRIPESMPTFDPENWCLHQEFVDAIMNMYTVDEVDINFYPERKIVPHKIKAGPSEFKILVVPNTVKDEYLTYVPAKHCLKMNDDGTVFVDPSFL